MTKLELLNCFLTERLSATANEIFQVIEKTVLEYQEEIVRSKYENERLRRLLDLSVSVEMTRPDSKLIDSEHGTPLEQQHCELELSLRREQEDPEITIIKVEQDLKTWKREDQLQGSETNSSQAIFTTPSYAKREHDQDPPQHKNIFKTKAVGIRENDCLPSTSFKQFKMETDEASCTSESIDSQSCCPVNLDYSTSPGDNNICFRDMDRLLPESNTMGPKHTNFLYGETSTSYPNCGKAFSGGSHVRGHPPFHHGEKVFSCNVCGKKKNPSYCLLCRKCFHYPAKFLEHQRIHTGERPYCCTVCGKSFNRAAHLRGHFRTHTGEKPYSCPLCGKRFGQLGQLKGHLRSHSRDVV